MNRSMTFGQQQPTLLSKWESFVKNWMDARSETFSLLCGEDFTHGEVINVHVGLVAMLLMGALVNSLGTLF